MAEGTGFGRGQFPRVVVTKESYLAAMCCPNAFGYSLGACAKFQKIEGLYHPACFSICFGIYTCDCFLEFYQL